jgi:hypothetical protein
MKHSATRDWKTIAHWTATGLFAALMLLSASMYLSGAAPIRDGMTALGYPAYILVILGTAKLLGSFALLQTRLPLLREWAYAGFTINLLGASASHLLAGDGLAATMLPAALLVPLAVSYTLQPVRPRSVIDGLASRITRAA